MRTYDDVLKDLVPMVADILALEPEEVQPNSRLMEDLGAESIDDLDLIFRCQQHFKVKVPLEKLMATDELLTDETGRLTPESLAGFKAKYPFLDYSQFEQDPVKLRMTELLTVGAIAHMVVEALAASDHAPESGVTSAEGTPAADLA